MTNKSLVEASGNCKPVCFACLAPTGETALSVDDNIECEDKPPSEIQKIKEKFDAHTKTSLTGTCAGMKQYCTDPEDIPRELVREFVGSCPRTCKIGPCFRRLENCNTDRDARNFKGAPCVHKQTGRKYDIFSVYIYRFSNISTAFGCYPSPVTPLTANHFVYHSGLGSWVDQKATARHYKARGEENKNFDSLKKKLREILSDAKRQQASWTRLPNANYTNPCQSYYAFSRNHDYSKCKDHICWELTKLTTPRGTQRKDVVSYAMNVEVSAKSWTWSDETCQCVSGMPSDDYKRRKCTGRGSSKNRFGISEV